MEMTLSSLLCISLLMWANIPEVEATRHDTAIIGVSCVRQELMEQIKELKELLTTETQRLHKIIDEEREERLKLADEFKQYVELNSSCDGQSQRATKSVAMEKLSTEIPNNSNEERNPKNCDEIYKLGTRRSGVYTLSITDDQHEVHQVEAYCDMDTSTGGWTVFQRRQDGSVGFNRTWQEYKHGFGQLQGEHWLGNQYLTMMTGSSTRYTLRVDLQSFSNLTRYAEYNNFNISSESDKYRLNIGSYSGDAGDVGGLSYQNQQQFSTIDQDNDEWSGGNCAQSFGGGGFWYNDCHEVNLNGVYRHTPVRDDNGIHWGAWLQHTTLKHTEMKLKPLQ